MESGKPRHGGCSRSKPLALLLGAICLAAAGCSPRPGERLEQAEPATAQRAGAADKAPAVDGPTDEALVEIIRSGKAAEADEAFVAAVRRIDQARGTLQFDRGGTLAGVDLAGGRVSVSDADVQRLRGVAHLKRLRLAGAGITAASVPVITAMPGLTELALIQTQIDGQGLEQIARLANVASLDLRGNQHVNDALLEHLAKLPKLSALGLIDSNISDEGISRLGELAGLRLLDLRGCARISGAGLEHLRQLEHLKTLRLSGPLIDDRSLAVVATLPALTALTVEDSPVGKAGLGAIQGLPLEDLTLARCFGLTDAAMQPLGGLVRLRQLALCDLPINGSGLASLGEVPGLAVLRLNQTGINDAALNRIEGLGTLTRLELARTMVSDEGLKIVDRLPNLEHLDLEELGLSDAGVARLAGLKKLRVLRLKSNSGVTDASVATLNQIKALRSLDISQTGISPDGARKLAEALPQCEVLSTLRP